MANPEFCIDCGLGSGRHLDACGHKPRPFPSPSLADLAVKFNPPVKKAPGMKLDSGKVRMDLVWLGAPQAIDGLAKVLTWAVEVKHYEPHSWQNVPDAVTRYTAALLRHQLAIARGETHDPESGLPHADHVLANALFLSQLQHDDLVVSE